MLSAAVIVAHPDDEVLWCGGAILQHPEWDWFVLTLCRASDLDRSRRFQDVLRQLGARGSMADLDDGPAQYPLDEQLVQQTIFEQLPKRHYDIVYTHGPRGEYTSHRRHEECCLAVYELWRADRLNTRQIKLFAYEDEARAVLPHAQVDADERDVLDDATFLRKSQIITDVYGFDGESWEARCVPATEGFYCVDTPAELAVLIQAHVTGWLDA